MQASLVRKPRSDIGSWCAMWLALVSCTNPETGSVPDGGEGGAGPGTTQSAATGFTPDGPEVCGDEEHPVSQQNPTVYLVLDRSGSMLELVASGDTRWERVREAVFALVDDLGRLIKVGAAVFPHVDADDYSPCMPGDEVYSPKLNPASVFRDTLLAIEPVGGTPTAATLATVLDRLSDVPDPKAVILATDGAPNCNAEATCAIEACLPNVAGICPIAPASCCEPPQGLPENCIDSTSVLSSVAALRDSGAPVYVVGIPGTSQFGALLDQMALLGGTPQQGTDTLYYKVDDLSDLSGVFKEIAASLVSCSFDLGAPPPGPGLTNLYFDGEPVVYDEGDGWVWVDEDTILVAGAACARLKAGEVSSVQIVSGCPTVVPE